MHGERTYPQGPGRSGSVPGDVVVEPPLNNIRECDMPVVIHCPSGPGSPAWRATVYHVHDPDLTPTVITSVFAIRLEFWPDGTRAAAYLLMADDDGKPLVTYAGSRSNDEAQRLAELPKVWWRCPVNELRLLDP